MAASERLITRSRFLKGALSLAVIAASGCDRATGSVRLGFIGSVRAYAGDHDRAGRDGALLAVAEVNAAGGVNGQPLELIVMDDEARPEKAESAVHVLAGRGAAAIIGPMTSQMAVAVARAATDEKIVALSPTVTTEELAGRHDYFMRVYPPTGVGARALASYYASQGVRIAHVIADTNNRAHTMEFAAAFLQQFVSDGGIAGATIEFDPHQESSLSDVAQRLPVASDDDEVILILSTPPNVGILAQVLRRRVDRRQIGTSEWAANSALIAFGGAAVEGIRIAKVYNDSDREGGTAAFRTAFLARFYYEPTYSAACAYEAVMAVAACLPKVTNRNDLREALLANSPYKGIQGYFAFDAYGDVQRPMSLMTVKDGAFVLEQPLREE